MSLGTEERFVVVFVESFGRAIDSVKVWGPFDSRTEAKKWVDENGILHLDPYGEKRGSRVFQITPLVDRLYP